MSQTKKGKEDLKEIILNDDSNLILPEVSFPTSYTTQGEVKYGAKSNDQKLASEHDLLMYQQRVTRKDSSLTSEEIRNLVSETNQRRKALEQSIAEQKEQFQQRRAAELQARHVKEREEARAHRMAMRMKLNGKCV
jgi:deoxyribose-phosphate aldolase